MPPVGGVVVEEEQPPQGAAGLGFRCHQQLDGHLHPVGALDQQEPGLEHSVVPPTGQEQNQGSALRGSWDSTGEISSNKIKNTYKKKQFQGFYST